MLGALTLLSLHVTTQWYEVTKDISNRESVRYGATPPDQDDLINDDQSQLQRQNLMDQISRHRAEVSIAYRMCPRSKLTPLNMLIASNRLLRIPLHLAIGT